MAMDQYCHRQRRWELQVKKSHFTESDELTHWQVGSFCIVSHVLVHKVLWTSLLRQWLLDWMIWNELRRKLHDWILYPSTRQILKLLRCFSRASAACCGPASAKPGTSRVCRGSPTDVPRTNSTVRDRVVSLAWCYEVITRSVKWGST